MTLYEKQLADTRDALERISDLIRRKSSDNLDSTVRFRFFTSHGLTAQGIYRC